MVRGHTLVQNLHDGFSTLTATLEYRLRLLTATIVGAANLALVGIAPLSARPS